MKTRPTLFLSVAILVTASAIYSFSRAATDAPSPPAPENEADPLRTDDLVTEDIDPEEFLLPLKVNKKTGEMTTWNDRKLNAPKANGTKRKQDRLAAMSAIEDPHKFWKNNKPVIPPRDSASAEGFDMANPDIYSSLKRGSETAQEQEEREWSDLAILDPGVYVQELQKKKQKKERGEAGAEP